jgi:hypothetical protein
VLNPNPNSTPPPNEGQGGAPRDGGEVWESGGGASWARSAPALETAGNGGGGRGGGPAAQAGRCSAPPVGHDRVVSGGGMRDGGDLGFGDDALPAPVRTDSPRVQLLGSPTAGLSPRGPLGFPWAGAGVAASPVGMRRSGGGSGSGGGAAARTAASLLLRLSGGCIPGIGSTAAASAAAAVRDEEYGGHAYYATQGVRALGGGSSSGGAAPPALSPRASPSQLTLDQHQRLLGEGAAGGVVPLAENGCGAGAPADGAVRGPRRDTAQNTAGSRAGPLRLSVFD